MPTRARPVGNVRILIADDHAMFRDALRRLCEAQSDLQVIGEAADGEEAVTLTRQLDPDVLLLDLAMPRLPGLEVLRKLPTTKRCRIILLTAEIERADIATALQLGAHGVVMKAWASDVLLNGIRAVMAGEVWVDRQTVGDHVKALRTKADDPAAPRERKSTFNLTPRELEIVAAVATGRSNREIAQEFGLSEDTVKHHLTSLFDKTGASSRLELTVFAFHHGLLPPPL